VEGALAEPAAVGVHAFARSGLTGGEPVLIVGAGVIGLMVMKVASAAGCRCVVVESDHGRARRALNMGAYDASVFGERTPVAIVHDAGEKGFGAVFECVGRVETIDLALRCAPRGGTVVTVGVPPGQVPVDMALVQDGELDIRGTMMYMGPDFERAIELISAGAIGADEFVTHRVSLDEVDKGYATALAGGSGTLKVLVDIGKG
jgi:2-desacetyl-2-hydroxyethyl bacteriochlorophyllide A dehydrogenase